MQRPEIRSRQGRNCDYANEFRWAPVSDAFVVPDVSFNGGTKRVNRDERQRPAQNGGRQQRKRGRWQDSHPSDSSGQVLDQCQNETQTLDQGESPNFGTAPYNNDNQLRLGGSEYRDGACSRSAATLDTLHTSMTSISPATTHQQMPSLQDFEGLTQGNRDVSLYFDDLPNMQFDSNWFNAFMIGQDLTTLSAHYEDHVSATGDSISEQSLMNPNSVQLDSVPSDGGASLGIIERDYGVDGSNSSTNPVFGITKTFEHRLGPLTSSLTTCTEEIAFNSFMTDASPRIPALDSPGNPFLLSLREVTLAAYVIHIASEVMTGSLTTDTHLLNAFKLVVELRYIDKMPDGFYSRFLVQRFALIDIIMSLLRRRKPLAPESFILYQQHEEADVSEPSFRELTGCPQPVLSFLAKISILATDVELENDVRLAQTYQLETTMRDWGSRKYPMPLNIAPRSNSPVSVTPSQDDHLRTLNACFYWMAHLLLARRVFMDPTTSSRVQLYRKHLFSLIDRLPPGCGPDSSLPIPFYIAAREAIVPRDREWVRQKHDEMIAIYPDRSRELMMSSTEDIWSMSDGEYHDLVPKGPWDFPCMDDDMNIRMKDSQAMHFII
ncbi:transcriptional regulatory protein pro-1 [Fusarium tjaetaba]|uniref:Transcriptional regulatory protein pro-1 n=1 Tax=Fusarium tjaetaba TaxID=1567544 RepID=A0A8H5SDK2_9HYPO|nr:transcriptional regulatory protein pro-1 [Fusarium tjaetaba]KAF5651415.1 transcriptional regulatory protein pro-1 [Fusarium tjaetaba]